MGVKTTEEARALWEIAPQAFMTGPISGNDIEGDDIILFIDADGRLMEVVETMDGYRKMQAWL